MAINGKILKINLDTKEILEISIPIELYKDYIGGAGLAARLLYPLLNQSIDPLSKDNPLLFMAGALAGTKAPNCGRHVVCARSPLTNIWGESNSGGDWGAELKKAGWDGILFLGAANNPVYLQIFDDQVQIKDASELWGKKTNETEAALKEEIGDEKIKVACIGPAGENLVKYASIMNDGGRAAGRTGMGAVMGSKKLKAIVVKGSKTLPIQDEEAFSKVRKKLLDEIQGNFTNNMFKELGTSGYLDMAAITGDLSFKYFSKGSWEGAYDISGATMSETILKKNRYCRQCTIGCGRLVEIDDGPYKTPGLVDGPEYETLGVFGASLLCNDIRAIAHVNRECNELGLDTISCGVTIAFAYYLQEKGILPVEKTDGLELKWGDIDPAIKLVEKIAYREGIGNVLADGVMAVAKALKVSEDECAVVNGLEVPMHDPRAYFGTALEYATSHRGACHMSAQYYLTSMGAPFEDVGIKCIDRFENEGVGECVALLQDLRAVFQSLSMCNFVVPSTIDIIAELFSSATGIPMAKTDVMKTGERIWTLRRLINLKLGYDPSGEKLPGILMKGLDGGSEGKTPDLEKQLKDYYQYREWNRETGKPGENKIINLGLKDLDKSYI
ncbi:MAG: aldehyde ferredoxin oxidoreductase family protein [Promethearchaeota archaeon]